MLATWVDLLPVCLYDVAHSYLPGRKEILDGMLGANLVCFQVRSTRCSHQIISFAHLSSRPTHTPGTSYPRVCACAGTKRPHAPSWHRRYPITRSLIPATLTPHLPPPCLLLPLNSLTQRNTSVSMHKVTSSLWGIALLGSMPRGLNEIREVHTAFRIGTGGTDRRIVGCALTFSLSWMSSARYMRTRRLLLDGTSSTLSRVLCRRHVPSYVNIRVIPDR